MFWRRLPLVIGCLLPWVVAGGVGLWVVQRHIPKDGVMTIDIPLDGRSPWFEAFLPGQRATSPGVQDGGWVGQRITDDPVYARIRLPGAYDVAEVMMEFRPEDQSLLEIGVERGREPAVSYELVPLWSEQLETSAYVSTTVNGVRWLVDPLVGAAATAADASRVAWHASGTIPQAWMDTGTSTKQTIRASLRGQHDFWFVPVNGRIDLSMVLQDMNRSRQTSTASLRLMRDAELVWADSVSFGGRDDARPSPLIEKTWAFEALPPGVYRFSVLADDSIFIREWTTLAKHWVIGPRVYFADEIGYSTSTPSVRAWTNSSFLEVKTLHPEGTQVVQLGSATATIRETHATVLLERRDVDVGGAAPFSAPKGNVWTLGDGYMSWSQAALFFPQVRRFTDQTRLKDERVSAVATSYTPPERLQDGWYRSRTTFSLDPDRDRLKLILSAPGIARREGSVDVRRLQVVFRRPPRREAWWPAIRAELIRAWSRW